MKKTLLLSGAAIIMAGILFSSCAPEGGNTNNASNDQPKKVTNTPPPKMELASASYKSYSSEAISDLEGENKKYAIFWASKSCATCEGKNKQIEASLDSIPQDTVILRAEYDEMSDAMKEKYGVVKYDTFTIVEPDGSFETIRGAGVDEVYKKLSPMEVSNNAIQLASYTDYSDESIASLEDKKYAIFWASKSCGTCEGKSNKIQASLGSIPEGTTILRAEYDEMSDEMKEKYGVVKYDTFTIVEPDGSFETIRGASVLDVYGKLAINN